MSRIPKKHARAIDRLARRAHAFHRFAHHPLCGAYRAELIALGSKARVCRGCACVALGGIFGLLLGESARPPVRVALLAFTLALVLGVASLKVRLPKTLSRFAPTLLASGAFAALVCEPSRTSHALALLVALAVGGVFVGYRKRGPNRTPCERCPERSAGRVCSGFAPIVRRERAFRRLATRLYLSAPEL